MRRTAAIVLGGGQGTRLWPLTRFRAKPAVPIGGKYRLVDVPLSNCINSNLKEIYVLTQFNSLSLHRHIFQTYNFDRFSSGLVEILAAQQTNDNQFWFQGTADAVRQYIDHFRQLDVDQFIILAGDHLYRMDYREFIKTHEETGADVTISTYPITAEQVPGFGILKVDESGRIKRFIEKPQEVDIRDEYRLPDSPEKPYLASMGIYVFNREVLLDALQTYKEDDFGRDIIPAAMKDYKVQSFLFDGYWEDIGTVATFFRANVRLTSTKPPFTFYDDEHPFYTRPRSLPGSRISHSEIHECLINEGCYINNAKLSNSVIGIRSVIHEGAELDHVVVMGADHYANHHQEAVPLGIGENTLIRNAILDKDARIGKNVQIINKDKLEFYDDDRYSIRDGVVIVSKGAVIPDGTII
ncbi:MAG: glucose-1-phosphate adenylyltransferase [Candidatus Marinimicrobia bacterium]|nr:glucose-1-phosphate adenylyltransferase [Candidatus Neomarinimicrobiota bacterium]MCF7840564.1 glucose-1-phosphate adenylyltransferase [Candidatus Neomarinimicrobiota bacterium]MCF7902336.1 glucose-1-phosphate adenylyltransferase [Candidatus Neomarinimicrobiota bacterium]